MSLSQSAPVFPATAWRWVRILLLPSRVPPYLHVGLLFHILASPLLQISCLVSQVLVFPPLSSQPRPVHYPLPHDAICLSRPYFSCFPEPLSREALDLWRPFSDLSRIGLASYLRPIYIRCDFHPPNHLPTSFCGLIASSFFLIVPVCQ